jgi:hypothetical protein
MLSSAGTIIGIAATAGAIGWRLGRASALVREGVVVALVPTVLFEETGDVRIMVADAATNRPLDVKQVVDLRCPR